MSRALKAQLKSLRHAAINPRPEWIASTRATILAQITNTVVPERSSFWRTFPRTVASLFSPQAFFRPIAAVLTIALSVSGWVATSKASKGALPGDTLYAVKIATEKTQVAWVSMMNDKTKSAQLHIELAGRRADEAKKIVVGTPDKKTRVSETVNNVRQELAAATEKLEDIKHESAPTLSQDVVSAIKQQTDDIKKSLQEVKVNLQTSTTTADKLLSEEVADAKNAAKDADITTVQVAVADHLKANSALSKDYVNALIDTTLTHAVTEAGETKGSLTELKTLVTEAAHDLSATSSLFEFAASSTGAVEPSSTSVSSSASSSTSTTATSTPAQTIKQSFTVVAGETVQAALKTEAVTDQLSQKVNEIKQLVSAGNLSLAASRIQEVSDAAKEVEKISDASISKVQASLPDVSLLVASVSSSPSTTTLLLKEKIDSVLRSSTGVGIVVSASTSTGVETSTISASSSAPTPSSSASSTASSVSVSTTVSSSSSTKP